MAYFWKIFEERQKKGEIVCRQDLKEHTWCTFKLFAFEKSRLVYRRMLHHPPAQPPPVSIRVDRSKGIYAFYSHSKMFLGSFTVPHVLKYLTDPFGVDLFDKVKAAR